MPFRHSYYPETVVFVLDVCEDPGIDSAKHAARLDLLKQCIAHCAQAKSRVNPGHKFGLAVIRDSIQWEGAGVTSSAEGLLAALRGVQPPPPPAAAAAAASACAPGGLPGGPPAASLHPPPAAAAMAGHAPASPPPPPPLPPPLDLGALVSLIQPLAVAEEADGCKVRVVLLYGRSTVLPVWSSRHRRGEALCMDVLFVHDKTAAATAAAARPDCASPQDVYTWLEDNVDELSGRCGHHAYILEAGGHLVRKVTNHLISLVAHPAQRPPQRAIRGAPLDLATVPPQPTSATPGNAASSATATATAAAASGLDHSAFPPLPVPAVSAGGGGGGTAPAAGAWGSPSTPSTLQQHSQPPQPASPPTADLIDLTSSAEYPPPAPPPASVAATAVASPAPTAGQSGFVMEQMQPSPPAAALSSSPPPPAYYWPPGLGPTAAAAVTSEAAARGLAGLSIDQPPQPLQPPHPPAAAATTGYPGGVGGGGGGGAFAVETPPWPTDQVPPPPAAGHWPH